MSKTKYYRQCRLVRHVGPSTIEQTSFIPEEYANVGSYLKLKDTSGNWVDGWKVEAAGEKKDAVFVEANERIWKRARPNSDI